MLEHSGPRLARLTLSALTSRPLWLALGTVNVLAGVVIALRPTQSFDVDIVTAWCRDWLINGVNPYPGVEFRTNYPPYALVALSPLALLPHGLLKGTWAILSGGLGVAAGWLGLQTAKSARRGVSAIRLSIGCFLAWESLRIGLGLGQFTLLALASGLAAVVYRGTIGRGILLGLAMIKPQVGAAFLLWAILEGASASLLVAGASLVAGTLLFAARLAESPLQVVTLYAKVLGRELSGSDFRQGTLELRPLIRDLIGQPAVADTVHVAVVAGALILLIAVSRRMSLAGRTLFLLPLTCLWTLMSVYHATYDLVLLWPAAVATAVWLDDPRPQPIALATLAAVEGALLIDIPGLWWKLNGRPPVILHESAVGIAIHHFDRLLVLGIFVALVTVALRWQPADDRVTVPINAIAVS